MSDRLVVSPESIRAAAAAINPVFCGSPQFESTALSDSLGCTVVLKVETVNPVRSFKGRGGEWLAINQDPSRALVCASAGNLGQGIAYGARSRGLEVHVFAAASANPLKVASMERLGASVHIVNGDFDSAKQAAAAAAEQNDWDLIEDGTNTELAEGAGTIALELTAAYGGSLDAVFVPVGNGSLACGVGTWFKAVSPSTRVIGVSTEAAPATWNAWRSGVFEAGSPITTIAEGLAARVPVEPAVGVLREVLDEFVLVSEESILDAVETLWSSDGITTEPSGAVALSGAFKLHPNGASRIALILGGGNVRPAVFRNALARHN